jgi:hypothetical protein
MVYPLYWFDILARFRPEIAIFRNFGVNHAKDVTGSGELVRLTEVRLRAMPLMSLNLQKMAISGSETNQCP